MSINEGIKERLKIIKRRRTLKEFAEFLEVPYSTLHYYFNGREPRLSFLLEVCEKTGVSEDWLLFGKGPIFKKDIPEQSSTTNKINIFSILDFLKNKWDTLSPKEKHWFEIEIKRFLNEYSD